MHSNGKQPFLSGCGSDTKVFIILRITSWVFPCWFLYPLLARCDALDGKSEGSDWLCCVVLLFEINQMTHWECWMNEYTYMLAYYSSRSKQIKEVDQRSICAYKSCTNILFFKDLLAFRTKLWKDSRNHSLPYLKKRLGKVHYLSV